MSSVPDDLTAELDRLSKIEQAATEGPWAWEATGDKDSSWAVGLVQDEDGGTLTGELAKGQGVVVEGVCESINGHLPDAAFIAESRTAMPRLLAAVEKVLELADECDRRGGTLEVTAKLHSDPLKKSANCGGAEAYRACAADLREAITREITGKRADR